MINTHHEIHSQIEFELLRRKITLQHICRQKCLPSVKKFLFLPAIKRLRQTCQQSLRTLRAQFATLALCRPRLIQLELEILCYLDKARPVQVFEDHEGDALVHLLGALRRRHILGLVLSHNLY